jgi:hypothetical protein
VSAAVDARGVEIKPGDLVVYSTGGRYGGSGYGTVERTSKSRVYLADDYTAKHGWKPTFASAGSCIVVTGLPEVAA